MLPRRTLHGYSSAPLSACDFAVDVHASAATAHDGSCTFPQRVKPLLEATPPAVGVLWTWWCSCCRVITVSMPCRVLITIDEPLNLDAMHLPGWTTGAPYGTGFLDASVSTVHWRSSTIALGAPHHGEAVRVVYVR
jgi:hypothetical protein